MGLLNVLFRHKCEVDRVTVGVYNRPPFGCNADGPVYNTQLMVRKVTKVHQQTFLGFLTSEVKVERLDYFAVHRLRKGGYRSFVVSSDDLNIRASTINELYRNSLAELQEKLCNHSD